jgi:methyl-accepting chemotaxis protein
MVNIISELVDDAAEQVNNYAYTESSNEVAATSTTLIICLSIMMVLLIGITVIVISGITKPLKKAVETANHVAKGNLNVDISSNSNDETGMLMQSLQDMINSISNVIDDVNQQMHNCLDGDLKERTDATKYSGAFRELVTGINKTIDTLVEPLNVASEFLEGVAVGSEDIKKITKNYKGDLAQMKNAVNSTHDTLFGFLGQLQNISDKAKAGLLNQRADVTQAHGA